MATAIELLNQGRENEIWKRYCVFLNLFYFHLVYS